MSINVRNKYKIHALSTALQGRPGSNSTFYETEREATERARECIANGSDGIVIYKAVTVVTPVTPEVEYHDVK